MTSNPYLHALRYYPYGNNLMDERYDAKAMNMIQRGDIEAAGSPNSKYLESFSATWSDRAIHKCWFKFDIWYTGMVNTPSYCSRDRYLPADSPYFLMLKFGFRKPVLYSSWTGDITSTSRLSIPLNFMLWWGRLLWGRNMCIPWTIIVGVVENGPTITKKISGGKLWCHSICIGKCNSMNNISPTKLWHYFGAKGVGRTNVKRYK